MKFLILTDIIAVILGIIAGYYVRQIVARFQKRSLETNVKELMLRAREDATRITEDADRRAEHRLHELRNLEREHEIEFKKNKDFLVKKESLLDARQMEIDVNYEDLKKKIEEVRALKDKMNEATARQEQELVRLAGMNREEARDIIVASAEEKYSEDILVRLRKLELYGEEKYKERARSILVTAIHRLASSTAHDVTTTAVEIPNEETKGKIIGKEGRNIRTFERITGVELIIDESPDEIIISSFDPVRRQIAKVAMEELIKDGRIQPAKIEEFFEKAKDDINEIIRRKGEDAVHECGIYTLDPRIVAIIGRLHFRTSYGQNVLQHSIEVAHLCEMLATELGADPMIAKVAGLVHDIGKALDHEVEGTHIDIGMRILEKFGADPRVITAMKSHHDDWPHETIEAVIVQVADMISGSRPGARRDTLENYLKRLRELEAVVNTFTGVQKSYALQAGREIRVFVHPDQVSDLEAKRAARAMAVRIEQELRYPGEIKVTVIRENRIIEYAR
ncbi:MAG: ribonuclease Y [bacterium]